MWKHTDLAWAAGFFDGEGSVGIVKQYRNERVIPRIQLHISQKDTRVLDKWYRIFPTGNFCVRETGNGRGITDLNIAVFEPIQAIFCAMWPYLGDKKKEDFIRTSKIYIEYQLNKPQKYRYRKSKDCKIFPVDAKLLAKAE